MKKSIVIFKVKSFFIFFWCFCYNCFIIFQEKNSFRKVQQIWISKKFKEQRLFQPFGLFFIFCGFVGLCCIIGSSISFPATIGNQHLMIGGITVGLFKVLIFGFLLSVSFCSFLCGFGGCAFSCRSITKNIMKSCFGM